MMSRHFSTVWDRGWWLGTLVAVLAPLVAVPLIAPEIRQAAQIAGVSGIVAYVAVLFADLLIYLHWRMTGGAASWLVLALTALTVQSLGLAGFVAADPAASESHSTRILLVQLVVALGLLVVVAGAPQHELRIDPVLAGAVVGIAVIVARYLLVEHTAPIHLSRPGVRVVIGAVLVLDLVIAAALFRLTTMSTWLRTRLGCAMALLSIGHAASYPVPNGFAASALTVATNVLGATVLMSVAVALVRLSWLDNKAALELLSRQLEQAVAGARAEQARLHELRATVGGLGSASRLVHQGSGVSESHRRRIEDMIDSEMERLQRLLSDHQSGRPEPVDLDATIEPIVLLHRTRGYPIRWSPSGEWATARADDVAEVVNVLLENAFQHAPGATAEIRTRRIGPVLEIVISDTGPGISRDLRPRIFEWGERGRASAGSGIGLNVAQQLTADLGGYLRLVDSPTPGSTFVLGLLAKDPT
jgi:signal transduction histidine kinase